MGERCVVSFPGGGRRAGKGHHCACRYGAGKELPPALPSSSQFYLHCVLCPSVHCDLWSFSLDLFIFAVAYLQIIFPLPFGLVRGFSSVFLVLAAQESTSALGGHVQMLMEQLLGQTKQRVFDFLQQFNSVWSQFRCVSFTYILIFPKDVRTWHLFRSTCLLPNVVKID